MSTSLDSFKSVKELFLLDDKKEIAAGGGDGVGSPTACGLAEFGVVVSLVFMRSYLSTQF